MIPAMRNFWLDLKFGARMVAKSPGASLVAILALGLGIGANTAIFSVADGILLHPLPNHNSDRVVSILSVPPQRPAGVTNAVSNANFVAWQQQQTSFAQFGAWRGDDMNLSAAGSPPVMASGDQVTTNFFQILPSAPILGRLFLPQEGEPGRDHVVILSQALWKNHFGGNPAIVGQTIQLDQQPFTVVGVLGADAVYPQAATLWMPLALNPKQAADRTNHSLQLLGLLKPEVTLAQAAQEMRAIAARSDASFPDSDKGWGVDLQTLAERTVGDETRDYTILLLVAVGLVLLIACANVANLQFARAMGRGHELSIRTALGAGRARLMRQILTENLLLGLGGALVGLGFAQVAIAMILAGMPSDVAVFVGGWDRISLNGVALAFTVAIAVLAAVLSGVGPAWHASRQDVNSGLKEAGRSATANSSRQRLRRALVSGQIGLALIVLIGAALLAGGFNSLVNAYAASDPDAILTARMNFPGDDYYTNHDAHRQAFYQQVLSNLKQLPGVSASAAASSLPLANNYAHTRFRIEGRPIRNASAEPVIRNTVSPGFFALLHAAILQGRDFSVSDGLNAPGVAIVSRQMAEQYWPGRSALGQHVQLGADPGNHTWLTVVGVAGDLQYDWSDHGPEPTLYVSSLQSPDESAYLLLRRADGSTIPVESFGPDMRKAVLAVNPQQPLFQVFSFRRVIHESTIGLAYVAVLMAIAGVLALVLAAIGIYGLMAYLVSERRSEIGIRMALGAGRGTILGMIMRRGLSMVLWGLAVGLPIAFLLAEALQSLIYGVSPGNAATYTAACAALVLFALIACYVPAHHATRVDPLTALRQE